MKNIPYVLIGFRLLLAPVMIFVTYQWGSQVRMFLVILIILGLLSDIFDGIVARQQGISTANMRRLDSQVDMIFWLSIGWCSWVLHPEIIKAHWISVAFIIFMEVTTYVISISKFGKETCTHALLSKAWGLTLCAAFISLIGFGHAGIPFQLAIIFGLISHIDVLLIVLFLPVWTHDVPSAYHAWRIQKGKSIKRNKLFNG